MSAFIRNIGQVSKAESIKLGSRFGRRTLGGKHFRNIGPLRGVSAAAGFTCDAADYDGTNDWLLRGAGLTGAADGSQGIFSCWVRLDAKDITNFLFSIKNGVAGTVEVKINTDNQFDIDVRDVTRALILSGRATTTILTTATWYHLIVSWDTNFGAGSKLLKMVINGTTQTMTIEDVSIAFNIDYTGVESGVGNRADALVLLNGCLAEVYFNSVTYLDVTQAANLAKWRTVGGKPENLGADGSTPTGTAPIVYQRMADGAAATTFATNLGGGGDYTITGTLDTCSSSPSD